MTIHFVRIGTNRIVVLMTYLSCLIIPIAEYAEFFVGNFALHWDADDNVFHT